MVQEDEPHTVVIDLDAATTMDMDGVEILIKIIGELDRQDIKFYLARVDSDNLEKPCSEKCWTMRNKI